MPLLSCEGCVKDLFVSEVEFIERFTGKELWSWGYNVAGELGNNSIIRRSSPVQTVSGGTNWKQVQRGGLNNTSGGNAIALKTDGTLWTWGRNNLGQLGNNTSVFASSPVQTVSGGTNWKYVSAGHYTVGAIKTDGTLWLWGNSEGGRLGNQNNTACRSSPVQTISGGTDWKKISVGYASVAAIKTNGELWMWGTNTSGGLGTNNVIDASSPVQTVSSGTDWKTAHTGAGVTAAVKNDGTLWLWGGNASGAIGDNTTTPKSSPVQTVSGGTNWKDVSLAFGTTVAIKNDGSLWLWGVGNSGQLGNNGGVSLSSPVQTVSGGTNWRKIAAGTFNVAGIKTDGTLWIWGLGTRGEIGNNAAVNRSSPVQTVSGGTNWKDVNIGIFTVAALKTED